MDYKGRSWGPITTRMKESAIRRTKENISSFLSFLLTLWNLPLPWVPSLQKHSSLYLSKVAVAHVPSLKTGGQWNTIICKSFFNNLSTKMNINNNGHVLISPQSLAICLPKRRLTIKAMCVLVSTVPSVTQSFNSCCNFALATKSLQTDAGDELSPR